MMMPYTTPTHTYRLPIDTSLLADVRISYAQDQTVKLVKTLADCTCSGDELQTTLTQEETALFQQGVAVQIQLHIVTTAGVAMQSQQLSLSCGAVLDEDVIGDAD